MAKRPGTSTLAKMEPVFFLFCFPFLSSVVKSWTNSADADVLPYSACHIIFRPKRYGKKVVYGQNGFLDN